MGFVEIADRVWVARQEWFDLNVVAIGGEAGLAVVDTHASGVAARAVVEEVRRLGAGEVVAVINTHEHFDHTFGNGEFRAAYGADLPIHATDEAAERTVPAGRRIREEYAAGDDPRREEVLGTEIVPADRTFSSVATVDLGGRSLELVHPGRGHTGGDLMVRVPDADVLVAGDLIEESAPPAYGPDCYPLDWPRTLELAVGLTRSGTVVVPGHGAVVDSEFMIDQQHGVARVAEQISTLAGSGVREQDALAQGEWPFPVETLEHAVRRGYAHLPRGGRQLPLA